MSNFPKTNHTTITRLSNRGSYDKTVVYSILDEALFCTIAYINEGEAYQIPTGFCRIDDALYIHGSVGSSYMRLLEKNTPRVCISATLMDGIVLARSAFHHSVNYRSVIIFSKPEPVKDNNESYLAMEAFTNKIQPGRWQDIRKPNNKEWKATMILKFKIQETSAKIRTGHPKDDPEDYNTNIWAGVIPLTNQRAKPIPDINLNHNIELPDYLK